MAINNGQYEQQRRGVEQQYAADSTTNAYSRFISQQRGSRTLGDQQRSFGRQLPKQTASYAPRGLSGGGVRSGAMRQSMQNYVGDYARNYGRTEQDLAMQDQQYGLQQSQYDAYRQNALTDIETQRANDIALTAQNIEYLRSLVGGL